MFNIWGKWEDVCVRKDYNSNYWLVQQKRSDSNDVKVRNISLDKVNLLPGTLGKLLITGDQGINNILKKAIVG